MTKPEKKKNTSTGQHISVTIDLLRKFEDLDITRESDLHVALYRLGFNARKDEVTGKTLGLTPFTVLAGKKVRCANLPYTCRQTVIFVGSLRRDFKYPEIYRNIDILDVGVYSEADMELVTDLPYDLPVVEKVNTRKYTKKEDREREGIVGLDFSPEDENRLDSIFGQGE